MPASGALAQTSDRRSAIEPHHPHLGDLASSPQLRRRQRALAIRTGAVLPRPAGHSPVPISRPSVSVHIIRDETSDRYQLAGPSEWTGPQPRPLPSARLRAQTLPLVWQIISKLVAASWSQGIYHPSWHTFPHRFPWKASLPATPSLNRGIRACRLPAGGMATYLSPPALRLRCCSGSTCRRRCGGR